MKKFKLLLIDWYIIKKFLGTFVYAIVIIIAISCIFDLSEHIDDFYEHKIPFHEIFFNYYLNFIPYFSIMFSPLIVFIAVIYFTSRLAYNTEIIALLATGMSFGRLLRPYMISAFAIALFTFVVTNFILPPANVIRLSFAEKYYQSGPKMFTERNIHKQLLPGVYIYMESYSTASNIGYKFSMEKFEDGQLKEKMMSDYIKWDSTKMKWTIKNYYKRKFEGMRELVTQGASLDTSLNMLPSDFRVREDTYFETMTLARLNHYISELRLQGSESITIYKVEKQKRFAFPFATFILTFIGVTLSSRKVKGGIGMHIGAGLGLSFSFIFFMQFSSQFAINGSLPPTLAAWTPNIIYGIICVFLYRLAPK